MNTILITGSAGLIGSQAAEFYAQKKSRVIGIDNDLRKSFFGPAASTRRNRDRLIKQFPNYSHHSIDVRDRPRLERVFRKYASSIKLVIHAAAQPSHDWAAREPFTASDATGRARGLMQYLPVALAEGHGPRASGALQGRPLTDFGINAGGTLNLLELSRQFCPKAVFVFLSTNKVYGDRPNTLPVRRKAARFDLDRTHPLYRGIDEKFSVDQSLHSLFGASKLAADILVQEYGRYFGMKTVCLRAGCLTGPYHCGAEAHGFLSYLMKCCVTGKTYTIYGYEGRQVRDNLHSADVVSAIDAFYRKPHRGEVYNLGGGRVNSCSILEAIALCEKISGKKLRVRISPQSRKGDHIWYITSLKKFQTHYPRWRPAHCLRETLGEIYNENFRRWEKEKV